jgi:hypothetical protein
MKCPKCLQENPDDSSFCKKCGTQILTAEKPSIPGTKTMHMPMPITELVVGIFRILSFT